jgi:pyruvate dehydrogenase E2 component (dihydrolipoamide acetyltransferase)
VYKAGDALVTVETEKAVVDVTAESDGVMLRFLADEGAEIEVGAPIAVWGSTTDSEADVDGLLSLLGLTGSDNSSPSAVTGSDEPEVAVDVATAAGLLPPAEVTAGAPVVNDGDRVFASPLARKLARDRGLDLTSVTGTGPGGRIRRRDVDHAPAPAPDTATPGATPTTRASAPVSASYEDVANSRIRQAIARRLTESKQTSPHFYVRGSARVDDLLALRKQINEVGTVKVSVNDLLVKAVARAHVLVPGLNVQWNGDSIRHFRQVDVAVAVATENGLVTPVVRGVEGLSLSQLAAATQDLVARAKDRRLQQSELEGGSISVSNLGMYGTEEFAAIINPPQASILAIGAARKEAVVVADALTVGTVLRVTLAVDHRPVDGATAAEWMAAYLQLLENPLQILL